MERLVKAGAIQKRLSEFFCVFAQAYTSGRIVIEKARAEAEAIDREIFFFEMQTEAIVENSLPSIEPPNSARRGFLGYIDRRHIFTTGEP